MSNNKFRAWNEVDKMMIEWGTLKVLPVFLTNLLNEKVKHHKLIRFTGLKDKNGVDIYEGDIILMHTEWSGGYDSEDFGEHESKGVVSIIPSKGVILNKCLKRDLIECEDKWSKTWPVNVRSCRSVVIGNIYKNPELLKPTENG